MASTKIINVLKDDKFEEVLDLFNQTSAQDVIFIIPKKSKAFSSEDHFATLQASATENDKTVSLLCSNPVMNDMARKYKFDVLLNEKSDKKPTLIKAVNQITDYGSITDEDTENPEIIGNVNPLRNSEPTDADDDLDDDFEEEDKKKSDDSDEDPEDDIEGFGIFHEDKVADKNKKAVKVDDDNDADDDEQATDNKDDDEEDEDLGINIKESEDLDDEDDMGTTIGISDLDPDRYEITTAAVRKNLDDIVRQSDDDVRNLKINNSGSRSARVGIRKSKTDSDFDKIKEVWDKERPWEIVSKPKELFNFRKLFRSSKSDDFGSSPIRKRKASRTVKIIAYVISGLIILCAIGLFVLKGSASITIQPYSTSISPQIKISAGSKYSAIDFSLNRIPGQLISTDKTVSKTFNATGEKDVAQKARGKIEVFNDQNTSQSLVATTRFQTDAGLIFRTLKSISIPAGKSLIVEVIADKAGADYNVSPSNFVVSSFKESGDKEKLTKVYGKSTEAMHGGTSGKAKVVTESDYNKAKDILLTDLKAEIENGLKAQSANLRVITSEAIATKDPISSAQIDEAADTFTMSLSGSVKTIAFKENDLNELVKKLIEKKGDIIVFPEKLEKTYTNIKFDEMASTLDFTITARGSGYAKVDNDKIINEIAGKTISDTKIYLEKLTTSKIIKSANVKLSFIWMQKMPDDKAKIKTELVYP